MLSFLVSRLASALVVMLGVVCLVFLMLHLIPGDPVELMLGESARPADRAALHAALGLDQPLALQLTAYLEGVLRLDLGSDTSLFSKGRYGEDQCLDVTAPEVVDVDAGRSLTNEVSIAC